MADPSELRAALPLRCVSKNVNGLSSDAAKRNRLFHQLRAKPVDLVLLQETHSADDAAVQRWMAETRTHAWRGPAFWHHGTSASRGVAILIRDSSPIRDAKVTYADGAGRLLRVEFTYAGLPMAVVNVYAPSEPSERPAFFRDALPLAMDGGGHTLVAGDFNCVLRAADMRGTAPSLHRFQGRDQLEAFMAVHELEDSWTAPCALGRPEPPYRSTFHTRAPLPDGSLSATSARLDRWLTPVAMREWISSTKIYPLREDYLPGDHGAVTLTLCPPALPPCGPGVWTLPLWVLNHDEYVAAIKQAMAQFRQQHAHLSARELWEGLKDLVADLSQAFCLRAAADARRPASLLRRTAMLAHAVCQARPSDCAVAAAQLQEAEQQLAQLHAEKAAASKLADDILWQDYGEQGTFWFHRLAHSFNPLEIAHHVVGPDGVRHSFAAPAADEREAAAECVAAHYEALFSSAPTDVAAQDVLLAATPQRLSDQAAEAAEGPGGDPAITLACLQEAVRSAPRGKRPGSDGLPYEFYSAFLPDLAPVLLAAFQETFAAIDDPSPLTPSQRLGLIVRIYKGGGKPRDRCESYRPITLLNCDYKLLARILVNRMNSPVNDLLSVTQTAFVPGRDIVDNVLHHLEEVDWLESSPPGEHRQGCLVFLDFEKAYDRMDRSWLMRCMQHFGFRDGCRRWMHVMMAGTGAQVLLNGHRTRRLSQTSGLPQGSPLSPQAFNLAQQPLASYFLHLQRVGAIRGIPLPTGDLAPPTHQHADDTVLHLLGLDDLPPALQALQLFCSATNARLNVDKSQGLLLGAHPDVDSPDGTHAPTGIRFVRPGEYVRHLGVLLARPADQAAAAAAMHTKRLQQLHAVVRQWSPFALSYVGRLYIAKQCMASVLYYHCQFIRPATSQLNAMAAILGRFVARPCQRDSADDPRAYMMHPSLAVSSLPREDGGLSAVDIRTQIDALQAKLIARLAHPRRHPWKVLMAAAISASAPAHLGVALPYYPTAHLPRRAARGRPPLRPRHADYLSAMRRMVPHRARPASDMTFYEVMVEPLFDNASVRHPHSHEVVTLTSLTGGALAAAQRHGLLRVRDLRQTLLNPASSGDPGLQPLLALLPPHWQAQVTRPDTPSPTHFCNASCTHVSTSLAFGSPHCQVFQVLEDGRLSQATAPGPQPAWVSQAWHPCCVVLVDKPAALLTREEHEAVQVQLRSGATRDSVLVAKVPYLVGRWDSLPLHPPLWAHGTRSLLCFSVRLTALRARRLRAAADVPGFILGNGVFPKSWASPGEEGGLQAVEQRWVSVLRQRQGRSADDAAGPSNAADAAAARHRRQYAQGWSPAPWLRSTFTVGQDPDLLHDDPAAPSAPPSASQDDGVSIARRVRARRESERQALHAPSSGAPAPPLPPPPPPPPLGDHVDLAAPAAGRPPAVARAAWLRLSCRRLPRDCRAVAWRVLHASLYSGVFWAYVTGRHAGQACCANPSCQGDQQLETMQHLFLDCPAVCGAADWLVRLWGALSPGNQPPRTAAVLLADDQRDWQPVGPPPRQELWTTLRLCWLQAVWSLRCRRFSDPERHQVSVAAIVAATVAAVVRLLRRDYTRTVGDARSMSSAPRHWFRGTSVPTLTVDSFLERWSGGGLLCTVTQGNGEGQGRQLVVLFSAGTPVSVV